VLYINTDANGRGFLYAAGSHTFQHVVNQVAGEVSDPQTGVPVYRRMRAKLQVDGYAPGADEDAKKLAKIAAGEADLPIDALGSGSDFTPFLQHVGVASLNLEFGGEGTMDGVYHSLYDDYEHHTRYVDPGSRYGAALARVAGRIVLEVADAEIVPVRFGDFAATVSQYLDEVRALSDETRARSETLGQLIDAGAFRLAADPEHVLQPPPREDTVPFLDLSPLENAVARLKRSAQAYDAAYARSEHANLPAERRVALNRILLGMEQRLLTPEGLPGREWYKHLIYAPGLYTGYGVKTLPGVREAIEERQWERANRYATITAKALDGYCTELDKATALLK
jgi:N-acetylated-alpha-linked acidic dipeptidase